MTELTMRSDMKVGLVRHAGEDFSVIQAAKVSTDEEIDYVAVDEFLERKDFVGLINYLMRKRHGSPFEHNLFTFYVEAPLFVFREWQRHRISSFNEMSGRYTEMLPHFYTPPRNRPMVNVGTSANPKMAPGDEVQYDFMVFSDMKVAELAWEHYQSRLDMGIANELARTCLPLSLYSKMYWTVNARSLMNFLSLRIDDEDNTFDTRPQWEIEQAARQVEEFFKTSMPVTHEKFVANGRIAP